MKERSIIIVMKNKEIVKNIRKIWREELKDCKLWMDFSYNDKRRYGRRLKLVCSVIGMGYYENMELRDNVIIMWGVACVYVCRFAI